MGLSSSKSKTVQTSDPYAAAKPAIDAGLAQVQSINQTAQPRTDAMSQGLANGFNSLAPKAFGSNSMLSAAQDQATKIGSGAYMGTNPGASVYSSLMAGGKSPGSYEGIGANNPALALLQGIATQQGSAPTDQFYADTLGGKYLNNNPYLDAIVGHANDTSTKSLNSRFAASGMGEGMSTPYASALGSALSNNEDTLRYGAYNNELSRMGQIAGQSDAMTNATRERGLAAANSLGGLSNQTGALNLQAQQAKDAQYNTDRNTQLSAAQSADTNYQNQIAQVLQALGLVPGLDAANYNGVAPMLSLASGASTIPYAGTSAYSDIINGLAGKYGTQTTEKTETPSLMSSLMSAASLGSSFLGGMGGLSGMLGGGGGMTPISSSITGAGPLPGIGPVDLSHFTAPRI